MNPASKLESKFEADPRSSALFDTLQREYYLDRRWKDLATICERHADAIRDEQGRIELYLKAGRYHHDKLNDPRRAIQMAQKADRVRPSAEARRFLAEVHEDLGNWSEVAELKERMLEEGDWADDAEKAALCAELAGLHAERLGNGSKAKEYRRRAAVLDPSSAAALAHRKTTARAAGDWEEVLDAIEEEMKLLLDSDKASEVLGPSGDGEERLGDRVTRRTRELKMEKARLLADPDRLDEPKAAAREYFDVVRTGRFDRAMLDEIDEFLRSQEMWDIAVPVLEAGIEKSDDPAEQAVYHERIGTILREHEGETEAAIERFYKALSLRPDHPDLASRLEEMCREAGDLRALARVLELEIETAGSDKLAAALRVELGTVREELGQLEPAIESYRRAYELNPERVEALGCLRRLYRETGWWQELVWALRQTLEHLEESDEESRGELLREIGRILDERLDRPEEADDVRIGLLDIDADDPDGRAALARAFPRLEERLQDEPAQLLDLYDKAASVFTDRDRQVKVHFKRARLAAGELDQPDVAEASYRRLVELTPDDLDLIGELEAFYAGEERWEDLAETYERELGLVDVPERRQSLHALLGELYEERLDREDEALDHWKALLETAPEDGRALAALERIYERREAWDDLLAILERREALATERDEKVGVLARMAGVLESLDRPEEAREAYRDALERDPAAREPAEALFRSLLEAGEWEEALEAGRHLLDLLEGSEDWSAVSRELVELLEDRLDRPDEAARLRREILAVEPQATDAIEGLKAHYRAEGDDERYAGILRHEIELATPDPAVRKERRLELGRLLRDDLERPGEAADVFEAALRHAPEDLEVIDLLVSIYDETDRPADLARLVEHRLRAVDDEEERATLLLERALVLDGMVADSDPDEVEAAWREAVLEEEARALAIEALALRHREASDHAGLHDLLLRRLEEVATAPETDDEALRARRDRLKVDTLLEVARLEAGPLELPSSAQATYRRILAIDGSNRRALEGRLELAREAEAWEEVESTLRRMLDIAEEEEELELWRRLADLFEREVYDPPRAMEAHEAILERAPGDPEALGSLETYYRHFARWEDLVSIHERALEEAEDEERARLLLRKARVLDEQLDRTGEALDDLRAALEVVPGHEEATDDLVRILERREAWTELLEVLGDLAGRLEGAARADVLARRARVEEGPLDDPAAARDSLEAALEADPRHEPARRRLARLLDDAGEDEALHALCVEEADLVEKEEAARAWDRVGRLREERLHDGEGAIEAFERAVEADPGHLPAIRALQRLRSETGDALGAAEAYRAEVRLIRADDPARSAAVLLRVGDILDGEGDREGATEAYRDALSSDPEFLPALVRLAAVLREMEGREEELLDVLTRAESLVRASEDRAELTAEMASIHRAMGRTDMAAACYQEVVGLVPEHEEALAGLSELYRETGGWQAHARTLETRAEQAATARERGELLLEAARVRLNRLADKEGALETLRRVVEIDPWREDAIDRLIPLLGEEEEWAELADLYAAKADVASPGPERATYALLAGEVHLRRLEDPEAARPYLEEAAALDPGRRRVHQLLAGACRDLGDWEGVAEARRGELATGLEAGEAISHLVELGRIAEDQADDPGRAVAWYRRALELDPGDPEAIDGLERACTAIQDWGGLAEALRAEADAATVDPFRAAVLCQLADVWESRLGERSQAIRHLEEARELDPSNQEIVERLLQHYRAVDRHGDLADLYEEMAGAESDDGRAATLLRQAAEIHREELEDPDAERRLLRRALQRNPKDRPALVELGLRCRNDEDWEGLAEVLERRVQEAPSEDERAELLHELGEVYEERLHALEAAAGAWERFIDIRPEDREAHAALARVLRARGRYDRAIPVMERQVERTSDDEARAALLETIGAIQRDRLFDRERAIEAYRRAREVDPSRPATLDALDELYRAAERWTDLDPVLERKIENARELPDDEARPVLVDLLERLGRLRAEVLRRPEDARETFAELVELDPAHREGHRFLKEIHHGAGRWEEAAEAAGRQLELIDEPEARVPVLLEIGGLAKERTGDLEMAVDAYEEVLEIRSGHPVALEGLVEIYLESGAWEMFVDRALAFSRVVPEAERAAELLLEAGRVLEDELHRPDEAAEAYLDVVAWDPDRLEALRRLGRLATWSEDWLDAAALADREARARTADADARVDALARLGAICRDHLEDEERAIDAHERIVAIRPTDASALEALADLHEAREEWERAVPALRKLCGLPDLEDGRRATLLHRLGGCLEALGRPAEAISALSRAVDLAGDRREVRDDLARLLEEEELWEKAYGVNRSLVETLPADANGLLPVLRRHVRICRRVGSLEEGVAAGERAMELAPDDAGIRETVADIHLEADQPREAVEILQDLARRTGPRSEAWARATLKLGAIYRDDLERLDRAEAHFREVMDEGPRSEEAMARLADLYRTRGAWREAADLYEKAIPGAPGPEEEARWACDLAEIHRDGLRDQARALQWFERALETAPDALDGKALQALEPLYAQQESWEKLAVVERRLVELHADDASDQALVHQLRLAELTAERLDDPEAAIAEYQKVIERVPDHRPAHEALARLYLQAGQPQRAVHEFRYLLEKEPLRPALYRGLARAFRDARRDDELRCTVEALRVLGVEDQLTRESVQRVGSAAVEPPEHPLRKEMVFQHLIHPREKGLLRDLLLLVGPYADRVHSPEIKSFGVRRSDRIGEERPEGRFVRSLLSFFGLGDVDLYVPETGLEGQVVAYENTDPPSFFVDPEVLETLSEAETRFLLARMVAHAAFGHVIARKLGPRELVGLFLLFGKLDRPDVDAEAAEPLASLITMQKLKWAIGKEDRARLKELMGRFLKERPRLDLDRWYMALEATANRSALLATGDLLSACSVIALLDPRLSRTEVADPERRRKLFGKSQEIRELVVYSVSPRYLKLRRAMKETR